LKETCPSVGWSSFLGPVEVLPHALEVLEPQSSQVSSAFLETGSNILELAGVGLVLLVAGINNLLWVDWGSKGDWALSSGFISVDKSA